MATLFLTRMHMGKEPTTKLSLCTAPNSDCLATAWDQSVPISHPWPGKRPQMGADWAGESHVPVTWVKVRKEVSLPLGGHVPVVPQTSQFTESSVTQEGLRWGQGEKCRVGTQLASSPSGTEYVSLRLQKGGEFPAKSTPLQAAAVIHPEGNSEGESPSPSPEQCFKALTPLQNCPCLSALGFHPAAALTCASTEFWPLLLQAPHCHPDSLSPGPM